MGREGWHVIKEHFSLPLPDSQCQVQGFSESLQHCIRPQNSVTSLYGRFRAEKLPYKAVTELWGLMQCCKDSENPCNIAEPHNLKFCKHLGICYSSKHYGYRFAVGHPTLTVLPWRPEISNFSWGEGRGGGGSPPNSTSKNSGALCQYLSIAPVQPGRFKSVNLMITTTLQNLNTWYKTVCPVNATVGSYFTVFTVHSIKVGVAFHWICTS